MPTYFAGFDSSTFPGNELMGWFQENTNLTWCGYYLAAAPSHEDTSWMGQRANLQSDGWGLAPIYVGQQVTGPGSHEVTTSQGSEDGQHTVQLMNSEGFPANSWVYLDLENGPPYPTAQSGYVQAWASAVQAGGYLAGIYCSHDLAAAVQQQLPASRIWAFRVNTTEQEPFPGTDFPTVAPDECGYPEATMWQLRQNCVVTAGDDACSLTVDLSSSTVKDPSC
ncbi:glycoside hydrolase domain-containing protein [Dickeya fangzhongdai]|uniref:glycoside hydrolase domain-containing protein n=1 Tax=Dickeya fangzhongdai TaxID=1778540 RepID=UPI0004F790CD|nr:glycoside hydrolase domain-containing protein [Dickeya fangzhongdai]AIR69087.1 hypothetical protein LH89_07630 [Dickeya fangzhongdai]KGT98336.1 hypothetical protein NM75_09615 [Dickeya fangzhongdai]